MNPRRREQPKVVAKMNTRRGYTLVELLAVIAAATAIMGVAVGLLYTLMEGERAARSHIERQAALDQFASQFRRDVRAAEELTAVDDPAGKGPPAWQLASEKDRVVEYRAEQNELVRIERREGKAVRRQSLRLPPEATASIRRLSPAAPGIVRLEITPGLARPGSMRSPWMIVDAELAKDHRFTKREGL